MPIQKLAKLTPGFTDRLKGFVEEAAELSRTRWLPPSDYNYYHREGFYKFLTPSCFEKLLIIENNWNDQERRRRSIYEPILPSSIVESVTDSFNHHHHLLNVFARYLALRGEPGFPALPRFAVLVKALREAPTLKVPPKFDPSGRLHSLTGPAVVDPNGTSYYFVRGFKVPDWVILNPERITVELIRKERNVETRRVLMERYGTEPGVPDQVLQDRGQITGFARYLRDAGAELVHAEPGRRWLYRLTETVPTNISGRPTVDIVTQVVEVVNSTPEPDGTYRHYHLTVPPDVTTCHEAVASTFGLKPEHYNPIRES